MIVLGLLTNKWVLGPVLSPDGGIDGLAPLVVISLACAALLSLGTWLLLRHPARTRDDLINASVVLATLIACTLAAEAYLRLALGREHSPALDLFVAHPAGAPSYRLRPGLDVRSRIGEVDLRIRTNRFGMHWREVERAKGVGKTRIAFVGDSFTFGCWTDSVGNSLVGVFEAALDTTRFEVLNFGVPGYGMGDVAVQLREQVLAFQPDLIFVMFYNGNDVRDSYLGPAKYVIADGAAQWNPTVVNSLIPQELQQEGDAAGGDLGKRVALALSRSRLYQLIGRVAEQDESQDFPIRRSLHDYPFWSRTDYSETGEVALARTLETLDEIRALADSAGAQVAIATIPFREQVYARQEAGEGYDVRLPQRHVEQFAAERGVPYLDLLPVLRDTARVNAGAAPLYWRADVHFTPRGHRVAGRALADFFRARLAAGLNAAEEPARRRL